MNYNYQLDLIVGNEFSSVKRLSKLNIFTARQHSLLYRALY